MPEQDNQPDESSAAKPRIIDPNNVPIQHVDCVKRIERRQLRARYLDPNHAQLALANFSLYLRSGVTRTRM